MSKKILLLLLVVSFVFVPLHMSASVNGFVITSYEYKLDTLSSATGSFGMPFVWLILQDKLSESFSYHVWYDFQNSDFLMAWIDVKLLDFLSLSGGKIVAPSNQEWYTYPPDQLTPFFSEISGFVGQIGKGFDYGVGFSGNYNIFNYNVTLLNGDNNDKKDICARFTISPIKDLAIAFHTYQIWATATEDKRDLNGVDFKYTGYNLDIRAEYDFGKGGQVLTIGPAEITPGSYKGYYIMAGYRVKLNDYTAFQPVFKYNVFDLDVTGYDPVSDLVLGANFFVGKYFKLMRGYRKITDDKNALYTNNDKKDDIMIRAQLSF